MSAIKEVNFDRNFKDQAEPLLERLRYANSTIQYNHPFGTNGIVEAGRTLGKLLLHGTAPSKTGGSNLVYGLSKEIAQDDDTAKSLVRNLMTQNPAARELGASLAGTSELLNTQKTEMKSEVNTFVEKVQREIGKLSKTFDLSSAA